MAKKTKDMKKPDLPDMEIPETEEELKAHIARRKKDIEQIKYEMTLLEADQDNIRALNKIDEDKLEELKSKKQPLKTRIINSIVIVVAGAIIGYLYFALIRN